MSLIILAGPPASGKSTIGARAGATRSRAAVIEVDDLRELVRTPYAAPWEGREGQAQYQLGVRHSCLLAVSFVAAGYDTVIVDVAPPEVLNLYAEGLAGVAYQTVLLLAEPEQLIKRDEARNEPDCPAGTADAGLLFWQQRILQLHAQLRASQASYSIVIETGTVSEDDVVRRVNALLTG